MHSRIASDWRIADGTFHLAVEVPANTTAEVWLRAPSAAVVTESGKAVAEADGVKFLRLEPPAAVFEVGSGRYEFTVQR